MKRLVTFILFTTLIALTGCEALSGKRAERQQLESVVGSRSIAPDESTQVMYDYLLGQVAGVHSSLAEESGDSETATSYLQLALPHLLSAAGKMKDPQVAQQAAKAALYSGDDKRALEAAEQWLTLSPESEAAHHYAALASLHLGEVEQATDYFDARVQLADEPRSGLLEVAAVLVSERQARGALKVAETLAGRYPEESAAYYAKASVEARYGENERALMSVNESLALNPDDTGAIVLKTQVLQALGRDERALEVLSEAVSSGGGGDELRHSYARLLMQMHRYDEARYQYELMFQEQPHNTDLAIRLGLLSLELEELDAAERYFNHVLRSGRDSQEALYYLGRVDERRGDYQSALRYYLRVSEGEYRTDAMLRQARMLAKLGRVEEGLDVIDMLAEGDERLDKHASYTLAKVDILASQFEYARAYDLLQRALEREPDHFDLLYAHSMMAEKVGEVDQAIEDLRHLLSLEPDNPNLKNALGYTLVNRTEQLAEGEKLIREAYEVKPHSAAIMDSMGWMHYRKGELEKAQELLEQAYATDPDPEIAAHLGEVLWQRGEREEARRIWEEASDRAPDHDVLKQTIEQYL
ncbi:MAG: tetratricopeptide repeat protein [Pseudomonadota bacterium]